VCNSRSISSLPNLPSKQYSANRVTDIPQFHRRTHYGNLALHDTIFHLTILAPLMYGFSRSASNKGHYYHVRNGRLDHSISRLNSVHFSNTMELSSSWEAASRVATRELSTFFASRRFVTMFPRALHWSLFGNSNPVHTTKFSLRFILILSTFALLGIPSYSFWLSRQ
jgi:hypothetical protein